MRGYTILNGEMVAALPQDETGSLGKKVGRSFSATF